MTVDETRALEQSAAFLARFMQVAGIPLSPSKTTYHPGDRDGNETVRTQYDLPGGWVTASYTPSGRYWQDKQQWNIGYGVACRQSVCDSNGFAQRVRSDLGIALAMGSYEITDSIKQVLDEHQKIPLGIEGTLTKLNVVAVFNEGDPDEKIVEAARLIGRVHTGIEDYITRHSP